MLDIQIRHNKSHSNTTKHKSSFFDAPNRLVRQMSHRSRHTRDS